jgi:CDP-diacylglycerol--glycerol-3-phosphate 3-phosphatidyltransferase
MNWANRLTVARLFLTLLFVASLSVNWHYSHTAGLCLFILGGITDYVDGEIARRFSQITEFGKLMDPLVDKIMMTAGFVCLVPLGAIPSWVAVLIISREFLITGLRLLALAKGKILAAESMGKHKTTWQIVTIVFFLLLLSIREFRGEAAIVPQWEQAVWNYGGPVLLTAAAVLTLLSGVGYLWKNRTVIEME